MLEHFPELRLPDKTKCFPGFGLYDTDRGAFTQSRNGTSFLECRACESGRYSSRLKDEKGLTHACKECAPGTSQSSGAALSCELCQLGEYQNSSGSQSCNRCNIGFYQDQKGSPLCRQCPSGTTLGFGSVAMTDCGCQNGYIKVETGPVNWSCEKCGEGLHCPSLGTQDGLVSGNSMLGRQFVPELLKNYHSTADNPLAVYRCQGDSHCPGGIPELQRWFARHSLH